MPLDIEAIRAARPDNQIHYLTSIGSTMQNASLLAVSGAPHGTTVVAEEQTAGMGRLGRSWISEPELGLYCSILLRLSLTPNEIPIATLLLGLATADAIHRATNVVCDLRWPNDVLIGEKKVAGILAQLVEDCVVSGIGINVNHTQFPEGLRTPATSLCLESKGQPQSREDVLIALLAAIDDFTSLLHSQGSGAILQAFAAASSYAMNRRVQLEDTGATGTTCGLDEHGFLLVHLDSGGTERVAAGGVRALV